MQVEVTGPNRDLHSGLYGGAVVNPCNVLCEMIASLKDKKGHILIPGFYDDAMECSAEERKEMMKRPFDRAKFMKSIGVDNLAGEESYSDTERIGIRPTLDINGIWGGYTGEGAKTILPSKAFAKISMRLVPHQDAEKIAKLFEKILGVKSILLGFGLDTDAIHSPNENYPLKNYFKGIATIPLFFKHYSNLKS